MRLIFEKYKSILLYLVFGVCTTIINIFVYYICDRIFYTDTVTSTVIAWFFAVLFAYGTNRKWVFESNLNHVSEILKEGVSFFSCRLITGLLDLLIMYVCVDILLLNGLVIKIISNVFVIVVNYISSKILIFKKSF